MSDIGHGSSDSGAGIILIAVVTGIIFFLCHNGCSKAHADEPRCVDGFINKTIERICDQQLGNVCYLTHDNGHGINTLSCAAIGK